MPNETPAWEELKAGYTLRPSEEYLKQFEFEEAEVVETKLNDNDKRSIQHRLPRIYEDAARQGV